jgi:hypothetical protein
MATHHHDPLPPLPSRGTSQEAIEVMKVIGTKMAQTITHEEDKWERN